MTSSVLRVGLLIVPLCSCCCVGGGVGCVAGLGGVVLIVGVGVFFAPVVFLLPLVCFCLFAGSFGC